MLYRPNETRLSHDIQQGLCLTVAKRKKPFSQIGIRPAVVFFFLQQLIQLPDEQSDLRQA
jgi:hypothetical protein